ncbi:hypothetical protein DDB_G0270258 [Dictyostelium discoideum AX4]|uniref:Uncharacterized protein n=1 Tax=Dictyostelium discoideum TaxID=44689 RepID=Q55C25_DICDI|nr:hypothetical protein DDB_G0270258 [Dictyostelium discoideum AX4]EAL72479.1 hypothetical protein DDB_G0270258 [Dictyostelium discoideum AX4]|eukprot:XP_646656.1 hypothetical protein DDB_G0270258 [Dictyostelium discoideum AX4]
MENLDNGTNSNNGNKVSVRFIIDRKHQFVCLLEKEMTFKKVEDYLILNKPKELFSNEIENSKNKEEEETNFKFLYSGKLFNYKQTINDLIKTQNKYPLNCQLVLVKKKQQQQQQQHSTNNNNNNNISNTANNNIEIHFHGCFFDYDEFQQIDSIFTKNEKKNENNNNKNENSFISLQFLNQFLHSYWEYLIQRQPDLIQPSSNRNFPTEKLSLILRNVLKVPSLNSETSINRDQFRIIFYLFTSNSETTICPNGTYNIILKMIEQYHPTIIEEYSENNNNNNNNNSNENNNNIPFNIEEFNKIFKLVLSIQQQTNSNINNSNQNENENENENDQPLLSCKNIELLFYLYTANIVLKKKEREREEREKEKEKGKNKENKNVTVPTL